jgi:hypothetical protein
MAKCEKPNCTWGEAHRLACLARAVAKLPGLEVRREWIRKFRAGNGDVAADNLEREIKAQWSSR